MKRFFSRAISIFLILSTLCGMIPAAAINTHASVLLGDADGSGSVELLDVYAIEAHLAGEAVALNTANADVNQDSSVDREDVRLIKEYLAGNLELTMETVTITLDTAGGSDPSDPNAFDPITVGKGYPIVRLLPTPEKEGALFAGWLDEEDEPFYQHDPILRDITLTAAYQEMAPRLMVHIDSFALTDQQPDVAVALLGDAVSAEEVQALLTLETMDGGDPIAPVVTAKDGVFVVTAPYRAGGSYSLTLGEGLTFLEKEEAIRTLNLTIAKEEHNDLRYNPDLLFIEDTEEMAYTIDGGDTVDVLATALVNTDGAADPLLTGSFPMTGAALEVGDLVCIYETVHPQSRDYANNDYSQDSLAYIRITAVDGSTYSFTTLGEGDLEEVLFLPDMIPYLVPALPQGETGTVSMSDYAMADRALMGIEGAPEFNQGDYLVFYTDPFGEVTDETQVAYGQITSTDGETVYYKAVTVEEMTGSGGMYVHQELEAADTLDPLKQQALLDSVVAQVEGSGFAIQAAEHMLSSALETESALEALLEAGYDPEEIAVLKASSFHLNAAAGSSDGKAKVTMDGTPEISVKLIYGDRFERGVGIELGIRVVLSLDKNPPASVSKKPTLKFDLSATFVQEIALDANASVSVKWGWVKIFWLPKDLHVSASIDVKNYTNVSVGAKIYSVNEDNDKYWKKNWTTQSGGTWGMANEKILAQANGLAAKAWRLKQKGDKLSETYLEQAEALYKSLPQVQCGGNLYSVQELEALLGGRSVDAEMDEVMNAEDKAEYKVGLDQLMDRYTEMLGQESDWLTLLTEEVVNETIQIEFIAITIKANIVIQANINLALGADLEYQVGKRFSFWFKVADKQSGSSQMDLLDEHFGFQFYVMGALGLRAGVQADIAIGLLSTKLASIGGTFEFGPYVKLWGYFIFIHTAHRNAGSAIWDIDEELMGALFLEFGLYITVKFKAQVADGAFSYTPTLYHGEFPLLKAGVQRNVYDFAHSPKVDEGDLLPPLLVKDNDSNSTNGIVMQLPNSYLRMKNIDLREGLKREEVYPADKFLFSLSSSQFSIDEKGQITASPPAGTRYMECYLTITWKQDKMTFSSYGISITLPLIWTNYTASELEERFEILVAAGSLTKGYHHEIQSSLVSRLDVFDLPTHDEVLAKLNYSAYNRYNSSGTLLGNDKYSAVDGYGDIPTQGLKATRDSTYYFNVTERTYTLKVQGVQPGNQTRTFTTTYGQPFDLSALQSTGTNDTENGKYTTFRSLTLDDQGEGEVFALDSVVDTSFVDRHGLGGTATVYAQYDDIGLTASYQFAGVPGIPEYRVAFKKGTIPATETELSIYVHGKNSSARIDSIDPVITAMNTPVSYTVNCSLAEGEILLSQLTLVDYAQAGALIEKKMNIPVGTPVVPPTQLTRPGYSLEGWCTDEECVSEFIDGTPMPADGLTLYAKWVPMSYTLILDPVQKAEEVSGMEDDSITVLYGATIFDKLPKLLHTSHKFLGWTIAMGSQELIDQGTMFTDPEIKTLYAVWGEKGTIKSSWFNTAQQGAKDENDETKGIFYEEGVERSFEIILSGAPNNVTSDMFTIEYKPNSGGDYISNNVKPVNAGTYDVKITGPFANNDYVPMDELVIDSGLVINKADFEFTTTDAMRAGSTVVIRRPVGIPSTGEITYKIYKEAGAVLASNTTGVFYNVGERQDDSTLYRYSVEVAEDENYNEVKATHGQSFIAPKTTSLGYYVTATVWTGNDGWESKALASIYRPNETGTPSYNPVNFAFDANSEKQFTFPYSVAPWEVYGLMLTGEYDGNDSSWLIDSVKISVWKDESNPVNVIEIDHGDILLNDERGYYIWTTSEFKRKIKAVGNFNNEDGADTIDLANTEVDYIYNWNSQVTDQYEENYSSYLYYDPPKFEVSFSHPELARFLYYTDVTNFVIDTAPLAEYVNENIATLAGETLTYTVTVTFPEHSTYAGYKNVFTKVITVDKSTAPASLQNSAISKSVNALQLSAAALEGEAMLLSSAGASMTVAVEGASAAKGDTIDIPVRLSGDASVWGLLMDVSYDTRSLELLGYTVGDVFTEGMFTFRNNLAGAPYKLLATRPGLEEVSADGLLLTLHYQVRDTAMAVSSVGVRVLQAVAADGSLVPSSGASGRVSVAGGSSNQFLPGDSGGTGSTQVTDPVTQPEPQDWDNPFTDVSEGDWFYEHVKYTAVNGLFQGTSATTFSPNTPMTRGMLVTVLGRMEGVDQADYAVPSFDDTPVGAYYTPYVSWAAQNNIVTGYNEGTFGPDDPITRQDVAVVLTRYMTYAGLNFPVTEEYRLFTDEEQIAGYAKNAIQLMNKLGIINGVGENTINPTGSATRAEVAAMLHRFLELGK